jgi:hypothetical protein
MTAGNGNGGTSSDPDAERSIPLGVGAAVDDSALDPLVTATESRKLKAGSFVLILVVIMACGGLWFMKTLSKVSASSGANRDIEASIEKFLSGMKGNDTTKAGGNSNALNSGDVNVLAVLSGSYTEKQIPLDGVQRDPFILFGDDVPVGSTVGDDSSSVARRRGEIERAATQLELKSVLMGTQPLANIGGKIVRRGEEIVLQPDNIAFRVVEITKESVTVLGEDARLNLSVPFTIFLKR